MRKSVRNEEHEKGWGQGQKIVEHTWSVKWHRAGKEEDN